MDLFCENTLVHYLVVVCIYDLPYLLYLEECVVISKFRSTELCGLTRDKAYRAQTHCLINIHIYWTA